jgi:Outer membrane protein beta-barrel domain
MYRAIVVVVLLFVAAPSTYAQTFEAAVHVVNSQWSEFEGNDVGFGGRFTWKPATLIGVDADLTWYPSDFPGDTFTFSGNRFEGLFGITVGPRFNRVRPFVKGAAGFLNSSGLSETFPCITIFPPPLSCLMAEGQTMTAFEIGGGVEISATDRTFVRVDVGDRILKYPAPAFNSDFEVVDEAFYGHALRLAIAFGYRFQ